jgi:Domain of unknown function (DUF1772)
MRCLASLTIRHRWAMRSAVWAGLLVLATAVDGVLAGASLDQSIKQLPARHRIGLVAFSAYSRASDQANGVAWYAALGIGGALLTLAAAGSAIVVGAPAEQRLPLLLAGCLTVAHSFTTARAAPVNFAQRKARSDEAALKRIFERFERWQSVRAALQLATFATMLWALASSAGALEDA